MLNKLKEDLLSNIDMNEIEEYLENIIVFDRLSGEEGEYKALQYIQKELRKEEINTKIQFHPAILSNPIAASLSYKFENETYDVIAKTRSFSESIWPKNISGELIYIPKDKFTIGIIEWELNKKNYKKDLKGKIVISESLSPVAILEIQSRGAAGYIQYWEGEEELIHEGIFNPIWGMPLYHELDYYPEIPIIAISGPCGRNIIEKMEHEPINAVISTKLEKKVEMIPILEATIKPSASTKKFILIGSHIDSWYHGVTDNGTGNALALYLGKILNDIKGKLNVGIKIAWWPGHSNGRYAGSAIYARENYQDLLSNCLAYINIDMPGLKGASDYSKISSGPELFDLAKKNVQEVTGQEGYYIKPFRGWDQSFLNIGVTPYFVWGSTLVDGHMDSTGNSFMSWWWHTEEDTIEHYSRSVLYNDTKVYISAIMDLLVGGIECFEVEKLLAAISKRLDYLNESYGEVFDLNECLSRFNEIGNIIKMQNENNMISSNKLIFIIKRLNQIYYTARESYLQDWALEQEEVPGLSLIKKIGKWENDEMSKEILLNQLMCEKNKFLGLCYELELLLI